ncbi:hypothetical protein QAD02_004861 [Eretmocerus hayati]|uniref:Uncharacterized protein n=1 Tax=Eretmocerus hayati TaxID=131215 RepID=A0ACC2NQS5_9HYME|nr:hypothetical protein QAD02_004861 [Eretmocerus hayati]
MSEKQQFDEFLGGSEKLPSDAGVIKLASARASEMAAMTFSLENPQQTKMIFQKLPMHMRRRVMSHNAKRMPRKLRSSHLSQMKKSGLPPKTKRPSRKYRRRPQNLLKEYNRRQRDKFWLETHIWHAKRFKMIDKWGFKLAHHSNDRCFRANYRAVMNHCLIQDISYYTCLELKGPIEMLKSSLKRHCNPNELTFAAKIYINGEREGTTMFYRKDGYPSQSIGHVHFLWQPTNLDSKSIWIWVHPSFYQEVVNEIISSFNFALKESSNCDTESECSQKKGSSPDEGSISSVMKIFQTVKVPMYKNTDDCQLMVLRNCLNRFRLCGPLAMSIVHDAFRLPNITPKVSDSEDNKMDILQDLNSAERCDSEEKSNVDLIDVDKNGRPKNSIDVWYKSYYQCQENLKSFHAQKDAFEIFKNLNSPSQLSPNLVLALTVLDPRFFLPHKRSKSIPGSSLNANLLVPSKSVSESPLWDASMRNYVTMNCMSTTAINNIRSHNLVPGVDHDQFYNEGIMHKIPIILIQKPGYDKHNNSVGFSSGIDIILPAAWSMPFWLALILRCARPGGLRESESVAYESSNVQSPVINQPDTESYKIEAEYQKKILMERYFRLPPNKRVNYIKFGITSPFFCEWKLLLREWCDVDDFYVLRDRKSLSLLAQKLDSENGRRQKKNRKKEDNKDTGCRETSNVPENCYIPVEVTVMRTGVPQNFSIICLPTSDDLAKFEKDKKWSGPVESPKTDENEEKRRKLRRGHLALLRRLRRQRIRAKKKMEIASSQLPMKNTAEMKHLNKIRQLVKKKLINTNQTLIDKQAQTMANLYLPKCTHVRHSCDREVIGYVTQGGFSYSKAKGVGLGYIVCKSLYKLLEDHSNIVLIRNPTTQKYRLCRVRVID